MKGDSFTFLFLDTMIYLNTNTANQIIRLSLDEARQYYSQTYTHYLLVLTHEENSVAGTSLAQVCSIIGENQRYTILNISTIGLTIAGRYRYEVYGQNSSSNLNPNDASVVGLCEIGWGDMVDNSVPYSIQNIVITNDIIYNGQ